MTDKTQIERDADELLLIFTNEGKYYKTHCQLARHGGAGAVAWAGQAQRLAFEYERKFETQPFSASTVLLFAQKLEAYYAEHVAEIDQTESVAEELASLRIENRRLKLEAEVEAIEGGISAIEYGGNTGTREPAPACLARLRGELEVLSVELKSLKEAGPDEATPIGKTATINGGQRIVYTENGWRRA